MKINFIIPFTSVTGGIKMVFEYANRLIERGHQVNVIFPTIPYYFGKRYLDIGGWLCFLQVLLENLFKKQNFDWFGKKINFNLRRVIKIFDYNIPDADIVVATAWPTAFDVYKLNNKKGRKIYFIMHYESDSGIRQIIDKSYRLQMLSITISKRTKEIIEKKFNKKIIEVIPIGIDMNDFFNNDKKFNYKKRVLVMHDPSWRKGGDDAIEAIKITKKYVTNFDLVIYGTTKPEINCKDYTFIQCPISLKHLRSLFCMSDIFIYPSRYEGYGMPPMEAMACKCAVITTNVGAVNNYTIPNETAIVVPPNNPGAMALALIKLVKNSELVKKISLNGYNYIQKFTWEESTNKLENLLQGIKNANIS